MAESTPFELSRIYAAGWSAGRKCGADDPAEIEAIADNLNPHQAVVERERWGQGFKEAVARGLTTPARPAYRKSRAVSG